MNIHGMGIVCACGTGVDSFEKALKQGWQKPEEIQVPHLKNIKTPAYLVNLNEVSERHLFKKMRRADKFSKMAALAASEALVTGGLEGINKNNIGVIVATGLGTHDTTFNFLDGILDYGEAGVSPTVFSNSVHNAAASYISSVLGIQGQTLTVTQFYFSFHYALQLARSWLDEERCDHVLVGAVEQYGNVFGYICDTKLKTAADGKIRPFNFHPAYQVPGEGAAFFLVSRKDTGNIYGTFHDIAFGGHKNYTVPVDLNIIDTDGMLSDESVYMKDITSDVPVAAYSPIFGSMMTGSAFNCAAGVLMLKNQTCYANPVKDNPRGINLLDDAKYYNIEFIQCTRYNCNGENAFIYLRKYKEVDP
ncbi:MAG: beta-ketoacyl synthase chain length factor [Nitrospirae bacterium]|nr:beta-ketoacyl synthase chain length factor [Nitrospirota bacterium]